MEPGTISDGDKREGLARTAGLQALPLAEAGLQSGADGERN